MASTTEGKRWLYGRLMIDFPVIMFDKLSVGPYEGDLRCLMRHCNSDIFVFSRMANSVRTPLVPPRSPPIAQSAVLSFP
jgi:hypothetical protein